MTLNDTQDNNHEIEDNDQEIDVEEDILEPFDPKSIEISVERLSLDLLIQRMKHNEIDLDTDFQRSSDIWSNIDKSRLIESILVRLPLPAFYFDATNENKWLVIDGLQRLSAIRHFMLDEKPLELRGLEFLTKYKGATYKTLDRTYQRRIGESQVTVYLVRPGTPPEVKYSIFKRINTGGVTLNNQEIRNAMAKPKQRTFLKECCSDFLFKELLGNQSKRMLDQELVLRFLAFYQYDYSARKGSDITVFLDQMMEALKYKHESDLSELQGIFYQALSRCNELLGKSAFEKQTGDENNNRTRIRKKSSTLYEILMVALARLSERDFQFLLYNKDIFSGKLHDLIQRDAEFFNALTLSTQSKKHVTIRHQKITELIHNILERLPQ